MSGRLESINTSRGGVPKTSVFEGQIGTLGVSGDHQNDDRHHGGPDRGRDDEFRAGLDALLREPPLVHLQRIADRRLDLDDCIVHT